MTKTTIINGQEVPLIEAEVVTTYRHKETGELFKEKPLWEAKGFKPEDMTQDVKVIMPTLDLFGEKG
jgi:hypothetical protein|tara:strand:+ start:399 stop:599 length:201 start_codon:yes stop_codon:yes gene_type:complete